MNVQTLPRQPAYNSVLDFYERHQRALRIMGHVLLWVILWLFDRYYFSPRVFRDNLDVITTGAIALAAEAFILFYITGYLIFPRLLYTRRYAAFFGVMLLIYFLIYQINRQLFNHLQQIGNHNPGSNENYVNRIVKMLNDAGGWAGCFTNLRVFLWNYAYGFFFMTLILTVKAFKDIINYQKKLVILERDKFVLELNFLKAQVNPHFLFNTLNSVYARVFETNDKAADLVLRLSELMRYNLYETNLLRIALPKELAYIQNYLDLERNRLSDRPVVIDYEQSGQSEALQIAPLLLITFVENAFKHGIKSTTEPAYVQVEASITGNQLVFRVENSLPTRRPLSMGASQSGGIGLGNVRRRLDALYRGNYELSITPDETTYTVALTIQLEALM